MSFLIYGNLFFLAAALLFYILFAGADFGAGILELALGKRKAQEQRKLISHAMAPVWEANHVWIVLVVVILFMGFPAVYGLISTHLFIPVIAVLMGIVARGCAFTFRHYDVLTQEYYDTYTKTFAFSSLWTAFFLGVLGGAASLGRIDPAALDFHGLYIQPWWNSFCLALGIFNVILFALLASVYLVDESDDPEVRRLFQRRSIILSMILVACGPFVFWTADLNAYPLFQMFFNHPVSIVCFASATLLLIPFWKNLLSQKTTIWSRILGMLIVSFVVIGWYAIQFPAAVRLNSNQILSFFEAAAPEATLRVLLGALVVGSLIIFPALGYLFLVFKRETLPDMRSRF